MSGTEAAERLRTEGSNAPPRTGQRTFARAVADVLREPMLAMLMGGRPDCHDGGASSGGALGLHIAAASGAVSRRFPLGAHALRLRADPFGDRLEPDRPEVPGDIHPHKKALMTGKMCYADLGPMGPIERGNNDD